MTLLCVDVSAAKVERLKAGHVPIYQPGPSRSWCARTTARAG